METPVRSAPECQEAFAGAALPPGPKEAGRLPLGIWLQPILIALIVVSAFIGCCVGLQRDPHPHQVPIAVTAPHHLPAKMRQALGDSIEVQPAIDAESVREAVEHGDAAAALSADGRGRLHLEIAGADGSSTTAAAMNLVSVHTNGAGMHVTTKDVVPLTRFVAHGLAGFYAFGAALAGFVLASNAVDLASLLHLRHRFWLLGGAAADICTLAAITVGPLLGAVPAPVTILTLTLTLLTAATAFTTASAQSSPSPPSCCSASATPPAARS